MPKEKFIEGTQGAPHYATTEDWRQAVKAGPAPKREATKGEGEAS